MSTRTLKTLAVVGLIVGIAGCGGTSDSAALDRWSAQVEGVYRIDAWTRNQAACDAEGASILNGAGDYMAVFSASDVFGDSIQAVECAHPADCHADVAAARAQLPWSSTFSYRFQTAGDTTLKGVQVSTGYADSVSGTCSNAFMTNLVLTRPADGQVQVEGRTVTVDHPADAAGVCWTSDTQKAAAGKPCNQLEVVKATRIEAL